MTYDIDAVMRQTEKRNCDAVVAVVDSVTGSSPGTENSWLVVDSSGSVSGTVGGGAVESKIIETARILIREKKSDSQRFILNRGEGDNTGMVCGGNMTVEFIFVGNGSNWRENPALSGLIRKKTRSVIFGGGHCGKALAPVLNSLGFAVTVYDDRAEMLTEERFPSADQKICAPYDIICNQLTFSADDYVIVMTSGHEHDYEVLLQILRSPVLPEYIGAIGSKSKAAYVNGRLIREGMSSEIVSRIHSPIGLQIKSRTPEEIAVSIAAEIILHRAEKQESRQ